MAAPAVKIRVVENATTTDTTDFVVTAAYTLYETFLELKPSNSGQWDQTTLNAMEVGIVSSGTYDAAPLATSSVRVTMVGIMVEYFVTRDDEPPTFPPVDPPDPENPDPTDPPVDREVFARLEVDWDFDGTYTDETPRIIAVRGTHKLVPPNKAVEASSGLVSTMTATLNNEDNRYSSAVTTGALYGDIQFGQAWHAPCRFSITTDAGGSWNQIFQGVIKIPVENTVRDGQIRSVTLDCRGNEEKILNHRISTPQTSYQSFIQSPLTEGQLINYVLNQAGVAAGEQVLDPGLFTVPFFSFFFNQTNDFCVYVFFNYFKKLFCQFNMAFLFITD